MNTDNKEQELSTTDKAGVSFNPLLSAVYGIQHSVRDIDGEIKGQNIGDDEEGDFEWASKAEALQELKRIKKINPHLKWRWIEYATSAGEWE